MPATSKAQQRFMGMELAKKRAGEKTDVKMTEKQLKDFAGTKLKGLPGHVKPKPVGRGQAAPPKPGYGQGEMGTPRSLEPADPRYSGRGRDQGPVQQVDPASAEYEQMRSTYGPYDPPGYKGFPSAQPGGPMQAPPAPTYMPPSDGQVPGQGGPSSPIDLEIQRLLMMKQQQIQQGQQALQGQMGGQQPQPPMGGAPGMGQALPPGMAPPPIGTGLQTMPLGGKPLQDPMISSSMSPGIASRALGGPPPLGLPPISGMPPKPSLPGGPPSLGAKPAPKKGMARAKKVRGKPRPAAGGRGERKGKTGIGQAGEERGEKQKDNEAKEKRLGKGQAGAASCGPKDKKKVGMGQAGAPAGAGQLAANDPYMMVKGRPYEQMPNGMLAPMVSPSTGQEAQAPQPQQATAQPVGPPPQQGGVAPMGMPRPSAPPMGGPPPAGVGMGQGDPTIGGALASQRAAAAPPPSWMAQTTLGAPTPQPANPRPSPAPLYQGPPERRPSYYPNDRPPLGQGQSMPPGGAINTGVPSPAAGSTPAAGGISPMGMSRPRTDVPGLSGPSALGGGVGGGLGRPSVPAVGLGQSSKKSMPMKAAKKVGYR